MIESQTEHLLKLDPFAQVDAVRNWVFECSNISAHSDFLLTYESYPLHSMTVNNILQLHRQNAGGHLCAGINYLLKRIYDALGYKSWMYNFGEPNSLTHAIALVEVDKILYAQDAYFNFTYVDLQDKPLPFYKILEALADGGEPNVKAGPSIWRNIHLKSDLATAGPGAWAAAGVDKQTCTRLTATHISCKSHTSLASFMKTFPRLTEAYTFLAQSGFPQSLHYLLLFPLGVTGEEWIDDPAKSEILRRITIEQERSQRIPQLSLYRQGQTSQVNKVPCSRLKSFQRD